MMGKNGNSFRQIVSTGAVLIVSYVILFQFNANIISSPANAEVTALVFLPAFVRLLGFLLIGLWSIPFLFFAAALSLNFELNLGAQLTLAAFLEVGAPLSLWLFQKVMPVQLTFDYMTGSQLFAWSLVAAIGSAITYHVGLSITQLESYSVKSFATAAAGNAAGTFIICYAIKIALTFFGKIFSKGA